MNQTSGWLPPAETWEAASQQQQQQQQQQQLNGVAGAAAALDGPLPYGWEAATDKEGRPYYVK